MLAAGEYADARGAGLLYAANLLGILIGGVTVLAIREPYFRNKLRRQRRSRLLLLLALSLASWVGFKLYSRYEHTFMPSNETTPRSGSKRESPRT